MPSIEVAPLHNNQLGCGSAASRQSIGDLVNSSENKNGPSGGGCGPQQLKGGISLPLAVIFAALVGAGGFGAGFYAGQQSSNDDSPSSCPSVVAPTASTTSTVVIPKYGPFPKRTFVFAACKCQNYSHPSACNLTAVTACLKTTEAQVETFLYNVGYGGGYPTTIFDGIQNYLGNMSKWRHHMHTLLPDRRSAERVALDTREIGQINTYAATTRFEEIGPRYGDSFYGITLSSYSYGGTFCHHLALDQLYLWQDLFYWEDCNGEAPFNAWMALHGLSISSASLLVQQDTSTYIITSLKTYFERSRPYQVAGALNLTLPYLVALSGQTPAFPSGHNTEAKILGAGLFHDEFTRLSNNATLQRWMLRFIYDIGERRVIAGVHFPSDDWAGNYVANEIMKLVWPNTSGAFLHFPENETEYEIMCGVTYPSTCNNPRIPHLMP